jgi:Mrp family chromosome partitioning ATPase
MAGLFKQVQVELPGHFVIVDSPPVLATSDPLVIGRQVDGIILVIRAGKTPKEYLGKSLNALNSEKILGVVLNGAEFGLDSKYYYYDSGPNSR